MNYFNNRIFTGERACFHSNDKQFDHCVFEDGESPLKESSKLLITFSEFRWKYPLWYCNDVKVIQSHFLETARSGIWYTNNIEIIDSLIDAPKTFRRSSNIKIVNVNLPNASETFWKCKKINIKGVNAKGDYFGLNYLAWNSKNVTFINCKITSHQGLCYMENVKLVNCELIDTDLCFEFCKDIDADIINVVDSIKNPTSGKIRVKGVKELILDDEFVNRNLITIEIYGK